MLDALQPVRDPSSSDDRITVYISKDQPLTYMGTAIAEDHGVTVQDGVADLSIIQLNSLTLRTHQFNPISVRVKRTASHGPLFILLGYSDLQRFFDIKDVPSILSNDPEPHRLLLTPKPEFLDWCQELP